MATKKQQAPKARKVFISVLGTGFYGECQYQKKNYDCKGNDFISSKTRYIQQATLELLIAKEEWTATDAAYILTTQQALATNWDIEKRRDVRSGNDIAYKGLKHVIKEMNLPFTPKTVAIKDGLDETEIWDIFEEIFAVIKEGDELYFDLTHGFRYLPMLVLVFGNYTKFLKNTKKCSITYGNFEMRQGDTAPIVDLLPLAMLQDWTFAVADYLQNGYAEQLRILSMESLKPILSNKEQTDEKTTALELKNLVGSIYNVALERQTCRGFSVIEAGNVSNLKKNIDKTQKSVIKAFTPLIEKINESLEDFETESSVLNTLAAARWCFQNHQYQSATTFLEEGVISFFCNRHNIDYKNEDLRGLVTSAFTFKKLTMSKKFNKSCNDWNIKEEHIFAFLRILNDPMLQDENFVNCFANFCSTVRNDYNHCGFRSKQQPLDGSKIVAKIDETLKVVKDKLANPPSASFSKEARPALFINLTNHPHSLWDEKQLLEGCKYGEIFDMSFPAIESDCSSEQIRTLAENYVNRITEHSSYFNITLHIMGEMTFTYAIVSRLKVLGITCLASTTERNTVMTPDGKKISEFKFVQFRKY